MCIRQTEKGIQLAIQVKPNAKRDQIIGIAEQRLVVAVAAPPIEGRVNQKLIKMIAKLTKTPIKQITMLRGERSKAKDLLLPHDSRLDWLPKQ